MENSSLSSDVSIYTTTSSTEGGTTSSNLLYTRIIYPIIGTVGIIDNLFVIIVFVFFTKVADKVFIISADSSKLIKLKQQLSQKKTLL